MAENKKSCFDKLYNLKYGWNEYYQMSFIHPNDYKWVVEIMSIIRKQKYMVGEDIRVINYMFKSHAMKYYDIRDLIASEPRLHAQKFIGKKKIRKFIFLRDKNICLKCGTNEKLTLDHIQSIYCGGENKLSNLQTLCRGCNSSKSTKYIDYR